MLTNHAVESGIEAANVFHARVQRTDFSREVFEKEERRLDSVL